MRKVALAIIFWLFVSSVAAHDYGLQAALDTITVVKLQEIIRYLSVDIKGRSPGEDGHEKAAEYIRKRFESCGLKTQFDPFRTRAGKQAKNVYGWISGSDSVVVVGGHFDHLRGHPGADDNASGTALVVAVAEAFCHMHDSLSLIGAEHTVTDTLVFQLYSAEESGLEGSKYYCSNPKFPADNPSMSKHVFMLNADMVGRMPVMIAEESGASFDIKQIVRSLSSKYRFASAVSKYDGSRSDHACFADSGVATLWLFTGSHLDYHTMRDTEDKINYDSLVEITKYAVEIVHNVLRATQKPRQIPVRGLKSDYSGNIN